MGIREAAQLPTHPLRGALFENHVVSETAKAYLHHRRPAPLFFWRDRTGHEIDLVIDDAGRLFPVEIKSAQTLSGGMLDSLLWWSKLSGQPPDTAILIYGGDQAITRGGVAMRPWFGV